MKKTILKVNPTAVALDHTPEVMVERFIYDFNMKHGYGPTVAAVATGTHMSVGNATHYVNRLLSHHRLEQDLNLGGQRVVGSLRHVDYVADIQKLKG